MEETPVLGMDRVVTQGAIRGRGVLTDWAGYAELNSIPIKPFESTPILSSDIKKCITEQNSIPSRPSPDFIGLKVTKEVVGWCRKNKFAAVASDTPSFERAPVMRPHRDPEYVLYERLLCRRGMLIGELFNS